jgi:hypothetical protein
MHAQLLTKTKLKEHFFFLLTNELNANSTINQIFKCSSSTSLAPVVDRVQGVTIA